MCIRDSIVGVGRCAVGEQVACRIIAPSADLIRRIIAVVLGAGAIDPDPRTIAGQVVAVRLVRARAFHSAGQALQAIVIVGDRPRRGRDALL